MSNIDARLFDEILRETNMPPAKVRGRFAEYRHRPIEFCEEVLGFHPWGPEDSPTGHGGQQAILTDLWKHRFVKVDSCNNAGKSYLAAHTVLAFNQCIPNSMVISTAPSGTQLDHIWRPMRSAWARSRKPLQGRILNERIEIAPKWYAMGVSSDTEERYQGPHFEQAINWGTGEVATTVDEDYGAILVVVDEHGGMEGSKAFFWNALLGYMAQPNVYVLMIGNPNRAEGVPFEITSTGRWVKEWKVHRIAARDVPRPVMDPTFEADMRATFGEDHPQYKIRVEGLYVEGTTEQLFPLWLLKSAAERTGYPMPQDGKHIGVDVARHGRDSSVAVLLDRGRVAAVESWSIPDLAKQAEHIATLAESWGVPAENIHLDIGMGAGIADRLAEAGMSVDLVDWGAEPADDWPELVSYEMKFKNRKAEMHWAARQGLEKGWFVVPTAPYAQLVWRQLQWILYDYDEAQKMFIEPKKKLKTRTGGESPDFADAFIFALSRTGGAPSLSWL